MKVEIHEKGSDEKMSLIDTQHLSSDAQLIFLLAQQAVDLFNGYDETDDEIISTGFGNLEDTFREISKRLD